MLCAAALLCACSNEIGTGDNNSEGEEGKLTSVTLSVSSATGITTKGLSDNKENIIHSLYVLAFQPDKTDFTTYKLAYIADGKKVAAASGSENQKFSFDLRCSLSGQADTKLLLVANYNPYLQVTTGNTYEDVQKTLNTSVGVETGAGPAFADNGIPMFGFAGEAPFSPENLPTKPLKITSNMQLTANLLRAVARVDVGVGTYNTGQGDWTKGSVNFNLTEVYVFKPQNRYSLLPLRDNLGYATDGTPSVTAPSPAGIPFGTYFKYDKTAITNSTYCKAEIYIPEVDFEGGRVYDAKHTDRMALVIGGTYNSRLNYYRIDFTDQPTNQEGTALQNVLRNKIYRYTITGVNQPGYANADAAYHGKPVGLSFTTEIAAWETGTVSSPAPDMFVRMNFEGINGSEKSGTITESGTSKTVTVKEKNKSGFTTDNGPVKTMLQYNNLLGEADDNTYNGTGNGGKYLDVQDAFDREGPYARLIIAPGNATEAIKWRSTEANPKDKRILDAKKACWDYRGQGQSDWRLPRLSELYLIWLNRLTINQSKGFTSLGSSGVTYWSGTEGKNDQAYAVNAAGEITLHAKTQQYSVRCVREVR